MYFIKFFPDLELSLGTQEVRLLYISLLTDNDLNSNHFDIDPLIIDAYQKALEDTVRELGIKEVKTA
jgi:hypothetical protein